MTVPPKWPAGPLLGQMVNLPLQVPPTVLEAVLYEFTAEMTAQEPIAYVRRQFAPPPNSSTTLSPMARVRAAELAMKAWLGELLARRYAAIEDPASTKGGTSMILNSADQRCHQRPRPGPITIILGRHARRDRCLIEAPGSNQPVPPLRYGRRL